MSDKPDNPFSLAFERGGIYIRGPHGLLYDNADHGKDAAIRFRDEDAAQDRVNVLNASYHDDSQMCTCCERRSTLCDCGTIEQWVDYGDHGLLLAVEALLAVDNEAAGTLGRKFAQLRRGALDALFLPNKGGSEA